jgi:peptide deformylase
MPVRKIVTYGHPALERAAEPVSEIDADILDLVETWSSPCTPLGDRASRPQVNVSQRVIRSTFRSAERMT